MSETDSSGKSSSKAEQHPDMITEAANCCGERVKKAIPEQRSESEEVNSMEKTDASGAFHEEPVGCGTFSSDNRDLPKIIESSTSSEGVDQNEESRDLTNSTFESQSQVCSENSEETRPIRKILTRGASCQDVLKSDPSDKVCSQTNVSSTRLKKYSAQCLMGPAAKRIRSVEHDSSRIVIKCRITCDSATQTRDASSSVSQQWCECSASKPGTDLPSEERDSEKEQTECQETNAEKLVFSFNSRSLPMSSGIQSSSSTPLRTAARRLGQFRKRNGPKFSLVIRATVGEKDLDNVVNDIDEGATLLSCNQHDNCREKTEFESEILSIERRESIDGLDELSSDEFNGSSGPFRFGDDTSSISPEELKMQEKNILEQLTEMNMCFEKVIGQLTEEFQNKTNIGNKQQDNKTVRANRMMGSVSTQCEIDGTMEIDTPPSTSLQFTEESYVDSKTVSQRPAFEYPDLNEKFMDDSGDYTNSGVVIIEDMISKNDCLERSEMDDDGSAFIEDSSREKSVCGRGDVPSVSLDVSGNEMMSSLRRESVVNNEVINRADFENVEAKGQALNKTLTQDSLDENRDSEILRDDIALTLHDITSVTFPAVEDSNVRQDDVNKGNGIRGNLAGLDDLQQLNQ